MRTVQFGFAKRNFLATIGLAALAAIGLATAAAAQTTTTNQNSQVNPTATWTHPYWGADKLCSDPACEPVVPILNPNQLTPLNGPDYYAYSPPVTKFVDPLPTVPIAVPNKTQFPGSDYYELSVEDYLFPFHRDMGPAFLRGYLQTNDSTNSNYTYTDANGTLLNSSLADLHHNNLGYLGPQIINERNRATRVQMTNHKSITGTTAANPVISLYNTSHPASQITSYNGLQIPVDETNPGSGWGPPVHLSNGNFAQHTTATGVNASYSYYSSTGTTNPYLHAALPLTNVRTGINNPAVNYLSALPTAASLTNIYNGATPATISWIPSGNTGSFLLHSGTVPAGYTWGPALVQTFDVLHPATAANIATPARATSAPAGFRTFVLGLSYFRMNAAGADCSISLTNGGAQPPSATNVACTQFTYGRTAVPAPAVGFVPLSFFFGSTQFILATSCNAANASVRAQLVTKNVCSVAVSYASGSLCGGVPAADQGVAGFTTVCPSGTATQTTATGWTINTPCTVATSNDCTAYTTSQVRSRLGVLANAACTAAAATIPGFCPSVTLTQYASCATTPAIPNALRPAACGNVNPATFAQYQSCTTAMIAVPGTFACVAVNASAQYASCAASGAYPGGSIPGQITCGNATLALYTTCTPALSSANPLIAAACSTDSFTQYTPCVANLANSNAPICAVANWTGAAACLDAANAPAPVGLIGQAGFACSNTVWAKGDYCNVSQVDIAGYQCTAGDYSYDRSLLHQHGGVTPWISDGTPHQWTNPVGDNTSPYKRGLSNVNIPDMPCADVTQTGCDGINTYYYTNQNSARMMWYHDHSFGITRLNVYAGEVSLYMLTDSIEQAMLGKTPTNAAFDGVLSTVGLSTDAQTTLPAVGAPTYQPDNRFGDTLGTSLVIQDKTFVWGNDANPAFGAAAATAANLAANTNGAGGSTALKDPIWAKNLDLSYGGACGHILSASAEPIKEFPTASAVGGPMGSKNPCPTETGMLWFPHVYSPNTDPTTGATVAGARWDFAPWVYPAGTIYSQYLPTVSATPESFMDTLVTNGKAYPYMNVPRKPMRFRILNASNDRYLNLQLYYAVNNKGAASGVTSTGTPNPFAFHVDPASVCNTGGNTDTAVAIGTNPATNHAYANCTEVGMVLHDSSQVTGAYKVPVPAYITPDPARMVDGTGAAYTSGAQGQAYMPVNVATWARFGGVPDPTTQVPFIQIGNESGFLPNPIVHYNQTVDIETDPRNITLTNVRNNPVSNPPTCPLCVFPYPGYTLYMGPAERADIIIDFGSVPDGATLILYNDLIAPNPGYDQRYDLFTGDSDMTAINGPLPTEQGKGPNTRTIMQFRVDGTIQFPGATASTVGSRTIYSQPLPANWVEEVNAYDGTWAAPDSTATLNKAIVAAFAASHADPIVSVNAVPGGTLARKYSDDTLARPSPFYLGTIDPPVFTDVSAAAVTAGKTAASCDGSDPNLPGCGTSRLCTYADTGPTCTGGITEFPTCPNSVKNPLNGKIDNNPGGINNAIYRKTCGFPVFTKAIAEDFDPPFGRINALLGNESTSLEANGQQTYGFPLANPVTERLHEGETQVWQTIHNGVDVHTIHFHLMNVQVLNRIDWAGIPKLPDPEERGWKDLIKMNPLETIVYAVRLNRPGLAARDLSVNPPIPFTVPTSLRVSDVTSAIGEVDPPANAGGQQLLVPFFPFGVGQATYANAIEDFSWEYVWHCHLLGHEEADMMRGLVMQIDPSTNGLTGVTTAGVAGQPVVPEPVGLRLGIH